MQLSRGESLEDTAQVLSRYLDAIAIRTFSHAELEQWADAASIPVVNALTDDEHPCQALADVLTIRERLGGLDGVRIAWLGDGTNVLDSLARRRKPARHAGRGRVSARIRAEQQRVASGRAGPARGGRRRACPRDRHLGKHGTRSRLGEEIA